MTREQPSSGEPRPIVGTGFQFDTQYTRLPSMFFHRGDPSSAPDPELVVLHAGLAQQLGLTLEDLSPAHQAQLFCGQSLAEGSTPFSQAYAGHQFGGFSILGDGRAHVLGEHLTPDGKRVDIQLKGSGRTPYSRRGDGRATLGPMLREYIVSEAMAALGIPTTRSLAVVKTGAPVYRETPLPGAVLTRVAASHLRIGTFELAAARNEHSHLAALLHYAISRHDPDLVDAPNAALALWEAVARRQVHLVTSWMRVGFVHGVMNTDNVTISGETIDYGPCAFLDDYAEKTVFSSIDQGGRYAFGQQPWILQWNLARLAEALLPLIDPDPQRAVAMAQERLPQLSTWMNEAWVDMMRDKLGLPGRREEDLALATDLLKLMEETSSDYTNTFRALSGATTVPKKLETAGRWLEWRAQWDARCERATGATADSRTQERMRRANPAVIPRNYRVEEALDAAVQHGDLDPMRRLVAAMQRAYEERPDLAPYQEPPPATFGSYRTFCGT